MRHGKPWLKNVRRCQIGTLGFYHYDLRAQALAKIERGQAKDLTDVLLLIESRRVDGASLLQAFEQSRPHLIRYPAIEPRKFEERLREFLATQRDDPTE